MAKLKLTVIVGDCSDPNLDKNQMNYKTAEEQDLVKLATSQDIDALNELFIRLNIKIKLSLKSISRLPDADLDDIIQDASIKATRNISQFKSDSSFFTWYFTIVRNTMLDFIRRQQKRM